MSKTYTTVQGDRWDSVAYKQLGSCAYAPNLMAANPQHLGYFVFPAGIVLTLPDTETQTSSTLPRGRRWSHERRKYRPPCRVYGGV